MERIKIFYKIFLIEKNINIIYTLYKSCIPYAGLYITPRKNRQKYSLKDAKNILEDLSFLNYAKQTGIPINGNSVRITSKDIEAYRF